LPKPGAASLALAWYQQLESASMTFPSRSLALVAIVVGCLLLYGQQSRSDTGSQPPHTPIGAADFHRIEAEAKARDLELAWEMLKARPTAATSSQASYNVSWYDVRIRVDDTAETLYGTVTCVATATTDGVSEVAVDLFANMPVEAAATPAGPAAFSHSGDVVTVTLDRSYNNGEAFEFSIQYHGHGSLFDHRGFMWAWREGHRAISSHSTPYFARTWWPCKDQTSDKADSISAHIEVDTSLYCASNGILDSITTVPSADTRTFHYTTRYPISTYLFAISVAPFVVTRDYYTGDAELGPLPLVFHYFPAHYKECEWSWSEYVKWALTAYESNYGPYPFRNELYGHTHYAPLNMGQEHQTLTSLSADQLGITPFVIIHELAHQWWGDMITHASWHDIWLTEGWATYSEAIYTLSRQGWPAYHSYMQDLAWWGGGTVWCSDTTDPWRIYDIPSYYKAAWVIHMLRRIVGEDAFRAGIQAYRAEFGYKAAGTDDFIGIWEDITGQDLNWFFNEWLHGQYFPKYYFYQMQEPSDSGGYDLYLHVRQVQQTQPTAFVMPVDVLIRNVGVPDDTLSVFIDERIDFFKFHRPFPMLNMLLDPQQWVLCETTPQDWRMFIITLPGELKPGKQYEPYLDTVETRGETGPRDFRLVSSALPPGLTISDDGIISGIPTAAGTFSFIVGVTDLATGWVDQRRISMDIIGHCCQGRVGDANGKGGDEPTISDVSSLIDALFITGDPDILPCLTEADVNRSGGIYPGPEDVTISDVSVLIDYLFITGPILGLPNCY
jgi:hypothetical protein